MSCRQVLDRLNLERGTNASLLMARYARDVVDNPDAREELVGAMKSAAANAKALYAQAFSNRHNDLAELGAFRRAKTLKDSLLISGLGSTNVLETGLTLNPTYGIPMIPGSSLKGITAHYCSEVLGNAEGGEDFRGPKDDQKAGDIYELLFGKAYPVEEQQEAGYIRFYDAWLMPECVENAFVDDVMTPHHSKYYTGGQEKPTDFDDPVPVRFLSVKGEFELCIACEDSDPEVRETWTKFVFDVMSKALRELGVGGKTRSGYGRMGVLSPDSKKKQKADSGGFSLKAGQEVVIICRELTKKKEPVFVIDKCADGKSVELAAPLKARKDDKFKARIQRVDSEGGKYIVKAVSKM